MQENRLLKSTKSSISEQNRIQQRHQVFSNVHNTYMQINIQIYYISLYYIKLKYIIIVVVF